MNAPTLARDLRARLVDARTVCIALALRLAPRASSRQAMVCCPWHDEHTPSCSVRLAKDRTLSVHCHGCGASGDVLTLIAQVRGLDVERDFRLVLRVAAEIANATELCEEVERPAAKREAAEGVSDGTYDRICTFILDALSPMRSVSPRVAAYLDARGVYGHAEAANVRGLPRDGGAIVAALLATFERADLEAAGILRRGRNALDWTEWRLLVPWRDRYGRIACVQRRRVDDGEPRYRFPPGRAPSAPYGVDLLAGTLAAFGLDAEVVIVEGALDALARRRIAHHREERCAVIGVPSASTPCAGLPLDLLAGRRVVLALDADDAGERACAALGAELRGVACDLVRERPISAKDWNAALVRGAV